MLPRLAEKAIARLPRLQESGEALSNTLHQMVLDGGPATRRLADALHGTWLGHPLHPVLTDVTIGAWVLGALFDALGALNDDDLSREIADRLTEVGAVSAVGTLATGLADFSAIQKPALSAATLHAALNDVNVGLYLLSVRDRRRGHRGRGVFFSMLGLCLSVVAAWIGGHLVYGLRVGVDHSEAREGPTSWTPVLAADALPESEPRRVDADGSPVLLYRCAGALHAIGAVCSHAGGPLDEGDVDGCFVTCPWHDSVFDVRDGHVHHGPATRPQPRYDVRERDGQIEIRRVPAA